MNLSESLPKMGILISSDSIQAIKERDGRHEVKVDS